MLSSPSSPPRLAVAPAQGIGTAPPAPAPSAMPTLAACSPAVDVVASVTDFAGLAPEWNELLAESPADALFLTWEWLFTWWKHFGDGRQLQLLTVRRAGRLAALAPFALAAPQPLRLLPARRQFLGSGVVGSDYLDVVIRPGEGEAVAAALAERCARDGWALDLAQARRGAAVSSELAPRLAAHGWSALTSVAHVCPYIDLTDHTWESYLRSLGASHRANVQRRLRQIHQRFVVSFERVERSEELGPALDVLLDLHRRRWHERGSEAFDARLEAFHRDFSRLALDRGWLRLYVLRLDDRPAAAFYGFSYGGRFLFYQSGFDPAFAAQSVGLVTMALTVRAALEEGAREYDLLHGHEPYKFLWARRTRVLERVELYPPSMSFALRRRLRSSAGQAKRHAMRWLRLDSTPRWPHGDPRPLSPAEGDL